MRVLLPVLVMAIVWLREVSSASSAPVLSGRRQEIGSPQQQRDVELLGLEIPPEALSLLHPIRRSLALGGLVLGGLVSRGPVSRAPILRTLLRRISSDGHRGFLLRLGRVTARLLRAGVVLHGRRLDRRLIFAVRHDGKRGSRRESQ